MIGPFLIKKNAKCSPYDYLSDVANYNMDKTQLVEIKKGQVGTGLLIERDGYLSIEEGKRQQILESMDNGGFHVPNPFVVDAVFQKYGIKNANGRIYPEKVLKKVVNEYQERIKEKRAYGECYRPEAMILTEDGWKHLADVKEGENILTLNTETNEIEIKPIIKKICYDFNGNMINIKGRHINDLVTPDHQFPLYSSRNHTFKGFYSATEIKNRTISDINKLYIPKRGIWTESGDEYFVLKGIECPTEKMLKNHPDCKEDKKIKMSTFMKFLGIYLAEGDFRSTNNDVDIYQKKQSVRDLIREMLIDLDLNFTSYMSTSGCEVFRICDPRLNNYVKDLGNVYTKYIPKYIKNQSKENLELLYEWFVLGDGRIRGDQRRESLSLTTDAFSVSKQLVLDLNEIQLKIGYSGHFHTEDRSNDRMIEGRLIKGENCKEMHFTLKSLSNGVYMDERFISVEEQEYSGQVMCVEVENHTWYVMENGFSHWTKNCNHPSESTIDLGRISHNITELHWEGKTLVGKMELNITEGYRRHGIVSSYGDTIANLLLNGYKIGVSSRGVGSVEQKMGEYIVGDDFELICWDCVSDPSTPNAYISTDGPNGLKSYMEKDEKDGKQLVESSSSNDKLERINELLGL